MSWQDLVLSGATLVFNIALLPSVFGKDKPAVSTSLITGALLIIITIVYISLAFWFATVMAAVNAFLWLVLAAQQLARHRK